MLSNTAYCLNETTEHLQGHYIWSEIEATESQNLLNLMALQLKEGVIEYQLMLLVIVMSLEDGRLLMLVNVYLNSPIDSVPSEM